MKNRKKKHSIVNNESLKNSKKRKKQSPVEGNAIGTVDTTPNRMKESALHRFAVVNSKRKAAKSKKKVAVHRDMDGSKQNNSNTLKDISDFTGKDKMVGKKAGKKRGKKLVNLGKVKSSKQVGSKESLDKTGKSIAQKGKDRAGTKMDRVGKKMDRAGKGKGTAKKKGADARKGNDTNEAKSNVLSTNASPTKVFARHKKAKLNTVRVANESKICKNDGSDAAEHSMETIVSACKKQISSPVRKSPGLKMDSLMEKMNKKRRINVNTIGVKSNLTNVGEHKSNENLNYTDKNNFEKSNVIEKESSIDGPSKVIEKEATIKGPSKVIKKEANIKGPSKAIKKNTVINDELKVFKQDTNIDDDIAKVVEKVTTIDGEKKANVGVELRLEERETNLNNLSKVIEQETNINGLYTVMDNTTKNEEETSLNVPKKVDVPQMVPHETQNTMIVPDTSNKIDRGSTIRGESLARNNLEPIQNASSTQSSGNNTSRTWGPAFGTTPSPNANENIDCSPLNSWSMSSGYFNFIKQSPRVPIQVQPCMKSKITKAVQRGQKRALDMHQQFQNAAWQSWYTRDDDTIPPDVSPEPITPSIQEQTRRTSYTRNTRLEQLLQVLRSEKQKQKQFDTSLFDMMQHGRKNPTP